ncbi:MAG: alpha/beta fold hydrolase [Alphaproteobacteria bacterium]|nr:alpha/beta fold hydrolase [Alphaproteobacteria bacterium]
MPWKFLLPVLLVPVIYLTIAVSLTFFAPRISGAGSLNFDRLRDGPDRQDQADLQTFLARDGQSLSFAHYPADSHRHLILLHGSGYHGEYLAPLARHVSGSGTANVYLMNIRGHHMSGKTRGDIGYVGQLEDDIADFIVERRKEDPQARFILGGHSSGGALAIRYAASNQSGSIDNVLALAPILGHRAPTALQSSGGWAHISLPRIIGLSMLNTVGIHARDHLETIRFNLPESYRNGTETLSYSWRLMTNFNLHDDYKADLTALPPTALTLVGRDDEAMNVDAFPNLFNEIQRPIEVMDGADHFSLIMDESVYERIEDWLRQV